MQLSRRSTLGLMMGVTAAGLILPRHAIAQESRRSIKIAVQKITNNNTLDVLTEQSNVG